MGEEGCMKKRRLITIVMIMTISVMLAACKSEKNGEENGTTTAYFEAVVEEVNDTVLLVDALESESNITGEITVPIDNSELYKVGDKIGVTFDGEIMESYPAQIRKPEKIEILSTDETKGDKGKVVALAMDADTWDSSNMEEESFIEEYSLAVSAKNIMSSGATIVFERTDPSITDELTFGEEFSIEKKVNDEWLEAEIVVGRGEKTRAIIAVTGKHPMSSFLCIVC